MNPEISIVTVTMNHLSVLKEMLQSLYVTAKPVVPFELIVVDNCSTDGTVPFVQTNFPLARLIQNSQKQGFAKNNNDGAKLATGNYILILNPDIVLTSGAIDQLYNYLKEDALIGIVAPQLLNADLSTQYSARKFMTLQVLLIRMLTRGKDRVYNKSVQQYLMCDLSYKEPIEVDWCMGAALLFEKRFYQELEGFDERFFLYVEDTDICHRCWKAGRKVVYLPTSKMIHMHQRSSKNLNKRTWMHLTSLFYFFRKNCFKIERTT